MKNSDMESTKDVYKVTFVLCGAFFFIFCISVSSTWDSSASEFGQIQRPDAFSTQYRLTNTCSASSILESLTDESLCYLACNEVEVLENGRSG